MRMVYKVHPYSSYFRMLAYPILQCALGALNGCLGFLVCVCTCSVMVLVYQLHCKHAHWFCLLFYWFYLNTVCTHILFALKFYSTTELYNIRNCSLFHFWWKQKQGASWSCHSSAYRLIQGAVHEKGGANYHESFPWEASQVEEFDENEGKLCMHAD